MSGPKQPADTDVADEKSRNELFSRPRSATSTPTSIPPKTTSAPPSLMPPSASAASASANSSAAKEGGSPSGILAAVNSGPATPTAPTAPGNPVTSPEKAGLIAKLKPKPFSFKAPPLMRAVAGNEKGPKGPGGAGTQGKKGEESAEKDELMAGGRLRDSLLNDDEEMEIDIDAQLDSVLGNIDVAQEEILFEDVDDRILEFQEDPIVKKALAKGVDLRDYTKQVEAELREIEQSSIQDYIDQSPFLADLHSQIQICDDILANMETLLGGFQTDLGSIGSEIQVLQDKSLSLSTRLRNRKFVQAELGNFLDEIVVPPELVSKICEATVDENYVQYLDALNRKITFISDKSSGNIPAVNTIAPELERLKNKASEKIRDFLLEEIKMLKKPKKNVNYHQKSLLKYKNLNQFLVIHHPGTAAEIQENYINIMNSYYQKSFSRYASSILKLVAVLTDKGDLVGPEEVAKKDFSSIFTVSKLAPPKEKHHNFTLGKRAEVLTNVDGEVILNVADNNPMKYPFEIIFRSFCRMLMDNASSEYLFLWEFFSGKAEQTSVLFNAVFEPTLTYALGIVKQAAHDSFDALSILLCIRVTTEHQKIMQHRRVPCLDNFLNQVQLTLWPRFQQLIDRHVQSVQGSPASLSDTLPHSISKKYGEFSASILTLNETYEDALVYNSLGRLKFEVGNFLLKAVSAFSDRKPQLVFLINNYDAIVAALSDADSAAVDKERDHWSELLKDRVTDYLEEELRPSFGGLMQFVKLAEGTPDIQKINPAEFEKISNDFATKWTKATLSIKQNVSAAFPKADNSSNILQGVLVTLLSYYSRFLALVEKRFGRTSRLSFKEDPISLENVKFEIKKLRPQLQ